MFIVRRELPLDLWSVGFSGHSDVHSRELPLDLWTVGFQVIQMFIVSRELPLDVWTVGFQVIQMFIVENCPLMCGQLDFRSFRCS